MDLMSIKTPTDKLTLVSRQAIEDILARCQLVCHLRTAEIENSTELQENLSITYRGR